MYEIAIRVSILIPLSKSQGKGHSRNAAVPLRGCLDRLNLAGTMIVRGTYSFVLDPLFPFAAIHQLAKSRLSRSAADDAKQLKYAYSAFDF